MNAHTRLRGTGLLLAALVLSVCAASAAPGRTAFSKLVVFGDSLNDTGNLARLTNGAFPNAPQYVYGRQTNGPVWVEYLAADLGLESRLVDYAVVGAMTKPAPGYPTGNVWSDTFPGLEGTDVFSQVMDYALDCHEHADPRALYILDGGANDFPRVADPSVIVSNLVDSLLALEVIGAKHIVMMNLPDMGKVPRVVLAELYGLLPPGSAAYYSAVSGQLNAGLVAAVDAARRHGVTITFADTYGFLDRVTADPAAYGLAQVQFPYLLAGAGTDPDLWLFWDDLHPTTRGHEIFADQVLETLRATYCHGHRNGFDQDEFPFERHARCGHGR